jgi:hypothetical protein
MPYIPEDNYSVPVGMWEDPGAGAPLNPYLPIKTKHPFEQENETTGAPGHVSQTDTFRTREPDPNINPDKTYGSPGGSSASGSSGSEGHNLKEMFEADILTGLLQKDYSFGLDPNEVFKTVIPQWINTVSNMGKLLLVIYVNYDKFNEEMGEEETVSLVQNISSIFQRLGKLVLKLTQNMPKGQQDVIFGNSDEVNREVEV